MSRHGLTVFVCRRRGVFEASTRNHIATDATSASIAARRCAAADFNIDERDVAVEPYDQHTMKAYVRPPARRSRWALRVATGILCLSALACVVVAIFAQGGVQ